MTKKSFIRKVVCIGLASLFLAAVLATGVQAKDPAVDLRAVQVGDVLAQGNLQDGACFFPPSEAFVPMSSEDSFFAFETAEAAGCVIVVTSLCHDVVACPEMAAASLLTDGSLDASLQVPMSHCDVGPLKRLKADYWTEGYPGVSWDGIKYDMLARTYTDMTWRYNCPGGVPWATYLAWGCQSPGPNWHTHWCTEPTCTTPSGTVCRGFQGEYECHPPNPFCSFGTLYKHQIKAMVRADNIGNGWCIYNFAGTLPPRQDGTCLWQSP